MSDEHIFLSKLQEFRKNFHLGTELKYLNEQSPNFKFVNLSFVKDIWDYKKQVTQPPARSGSCFVGVRILKTE